MAELPQEFFNRLVQLLPFQDVEKMAFMDLNLLEKINATPIVTERKKKYLAKQAFFLETQKQLMTVYCGANRNGEESTFDQLGGVFEVLFYDYLVPELQSDLAFEQWYQLNSQRTKTTVLFYL